MMIMKIILALTFLVVLYKLVQSNNSTESSSFRQLKPKPTRKRYIYQTHSPSRRPTQKIKRRRSSSPTISPTTSSPTVNPTSSTVKISAWCDDNIEIFINGIAVTTYRSDHDSGNAWFRWAYGFFNPAVDIVAIHGADYGGNFHCHLYFDDIEKSFDYVQSHLKCGNPTEGWLTANYDDSSWSPPYMTEHQWGFWFNWSSQGGYGGDIYCRYHYD